MNNKLYCFSIIVAGFIHLIGIHKAFAEERLTQKHTDVVMIPSPKSKLDVRKKYNYEILENALQLSSNKYGPYEIKIMPFSMTNDVTFYELSRGTSINITMSRATPDKDHLATPIRIPIRRGILNYRLLVINKDKKDLFNKINSTEQFKQYTAGIHANAVTSEILSVLGFKVTEGATYDGMFRQLSQNRFDYIPRGVHEAFDELKLREGLVDNLMIEPSLALYMPMPYYIYVSPSYPRLADRIEYGLEKMVEQKLIQRIFNKYYAEDMKRANLADRKIIHIGNPFLSPQTPLHRKELWIDDFAIKTPKPHEINR